MKEICRESGDFGEGESGEYGGSGDRPGFSGT
jgi:hypothetical protein